MTEQDSKPSEESYFGIFSASNRDRALPVLEKLGVRYSFRLLENVEEDVLREWKAWDDSSSATHSAFDLWVVTDDLEKLGFALADAFPEREYMGRP